MSDKPLAGKALRTAVVDHISSGRVTFSDPHAIERMKERKITAGQVLGALKSGALFYEQTVSGRHRYLA